MSGNGVDFSLDDRADTILLDQDRESVPIDGLDEIAGGTQMYAHGLIVDDGDHDYRYFRQSGVRFELLEYGSTRPFSGIMTSKRNQDRLNFLGKPQSLRTTVRP